MDQCAAFRALRQRHDLGMIWRMHILSVHLRGHTFNTDMHLIVLKCNRAKLERTGGRTGLLVESMPAATGMQRCDAKRNLCPESPCDSLISFPLLILGANCASVLHLQATSG